MLKKTKKIDLKKLFKIALQLSKTKIRIQKKYIFRALKMHKSELNN